MASGYVKNWRKIDENPYLQEYDIAAVFQKMIRFAQREDSEVFCKKAGRFGSVLALKRGQLWMSPRDWATPRTSYQRIRTILKTLQKGGLINAVTNAAITIITVCNYDEYQAPEIVSNADVNAPATQNQRASNAQNQEDIEKEREEREQRASDFSDISRRELANDAFKIWIDELGDVLPKPKKLEGDRRTKLVALLKNRMGNDLGQWRDYCRMVRSNSWNLGDNDRGWRADFDYTVNDKKARKILEKGHDSARGANGHGKSSSSSRPNGSALDDLKQVAIGDANASGESGGRALVLDEAHERPGGESKGNLLRLDQSSDGPPSWFDDDGSEFADQRTQLVAGDSGF